jgi:hypothetical protein
MTFLAPGFFYGSVVVAAAITALHFIVTRQPRAGFLPTARFVPDMPATATARATRPSDILLLLLRVLLVLAAGAGLAKPVIKPSRSATAQVVLADVSRSVNDIAAIRAAVDSLYQAGDVLIAFDSSARVLRGTDTLVRAESRGNLSAALIAAMRAGSSLRERADSVGLIVVSPFAAETMDAATQRIRALWPGDAKLIVAGRPASVPVDSPVPVTLRSSPGDAFGVVAGRITAASNAVVVRDGSTMDTRNLVAWPVSERPRGAVPRASPDTIGGVVADDVVVVATFERRWSYPADSIGGGTVAARWIDGEPAAVEWRNGEGCVRSVAIPVSQAGDFVLRDDVANLVSQLVVPCVNARAFEPVTDETLAMLRGQGGLVSREVFQPRGDTKSVLAPWLLVVALVLAVAEPFFRRRRIEEVRALERDQRGLRSAA